MNNQSDNYLASNVLCLVLIVVGLHAELQLLQERVLRVFVYNSYSHRLVTY